MAESRLAYADDPLPYLDDKANVPRLVAAHCYDFCNGEHYFEGQVGVNGVLANTAMELKNENKVSNTSRRRSANVRLCLCNWLKGATDSNYGDL